jgi:hypothetical protein
MSYHWFCPKSQLNPKIEKIIKKIASKIIKKNKISDLEEGEQTCAKLKVGLLHDASLQGTPGTSKIWVTKNSNQRAKDENAWMKSRHISQLGLSPLYSV